MQNSATSHSTLRNAVSTNDSALVERPSAVHRKVTDSDTACNAPGTNDGDYQQENRPKLPENIWESPPQKPVRGVVQPRVFPPLGKPTRHTNQLQFMLKNVLDPLARHQHAWPFINPVDAVKLNIPDYHNVVKRPMDLSTIGKRLQNSYYFSAEECMHDFETIFANCYEYNRKEDDVWLMCKNIENEYREKLKLLPMPEVELTRSTAKRLPAEDVVVRKRRITRDDFAPREEKIRHMSSSTENDIVKSRLSAEQISDAPSIVAASAPPIGALHSSPLAGIVSLPTDAVGGSEPRNGASNELVSKVPSSERVRTCAAKNMKTDNELAKANEWPMNLSNASLVRNEDEQLDSIQAALEAEITKIQKRIAVLKRHELEISSLLLRRTEARANDKPVPTLDTSVVLELQSLLSEPLIAKVFHYAPSDSSPSANNSSALPIDTAAASKLPMDSLVKGSVDTIHSDMVPQFETSIGVRIPRSCESVMRIEEEPASGASLKEVLGCEQAEKRKETNKGTINLTGRASACFTEEVGLADAAVRGDEPSQQTAMPCSSNKTCKQQKSRKKSAKELALSTINSKPDSGNDRYIVPMNREDKRRLSLDINRLPEDKLHTVVNIIKSHEGLPDCDADEVEFDIETLNPSTLRDLEAFVAACLKKKPRKPYTPKSQEDVDNRKRELEEKIRGLGGTVSAEYPLRVPKEEEAIDREASLSESSSSDGLDSSFCSSSESSESESDRPM